MCAWLADHIDHARLLVCTAVQPALAAIMIEVRLLDASLVCAVAAGDIHHALCLVLAAVQPIRLPWVVARGVLAALWQQALPVPDVDIHHARLLVLATGDGMLLAWVVEVWVLVAPRVGAELVDNIHHARLPVSAAEESPQLARTVEIGPGLAVWGSTAAFHAHHGACCPDPMFLRLGKP